MVTSLDALGFILMFSYPGFLTYILYKRFTPRYRIEEKSKDAINIFMYSVFIFIINLYILKLLDYDYEKIQDLLKAFSEVEYLQKYVLISAGVTLFFSVIWFLINQYLLLWLVNLYNKVFNKPKNVKTETMWEHIFEDTDITNRVVAIYKDGKLLKRGVIEGWTPPQIDLKEFIISYSTIIDEYFDKDYFKDVDFSYVDPQTSLVIDFYNMDKYNQANKN